VWNARLRFGSLCASQSFRALADWCLRIFVFRAIYEGSSLAPNSAWPAVTAAFVAPFLLLCPFNGAISNALPKRWVLVGAAGFCAGAVALCTVTSSPWLAALATMAVGAAVYSPTRYALLPAVAKDTGLPLGRVNSWIEMSSAAAIALGAVVGYELYGHTWAAFSSWPAAIVATVAANGLAMFFAIPARFPSDVRRAESPAMAVRGFFSDGGRILADREARLGLLGLAFFMALILVGAGTLAQFALDSALGADSRERLEALCFVFLGAALGSAAAGLQRHLYRALGLVPVAAAGLVMALGWASWSRSLLGPCLVLGAMGGVLNVPLRAYYQATVPADARGNGMAFMNFAIYLGTVLLSLVLLGLTQSGPLARPTAQLIFLILLTGLGAVVAGGVAFRPLLEQGFEILLWPFYRIQAAGPGVAMFPMRGPVMVVANHSAWCDPLWLGKVVPRFLTPMMTSVYYDKPVMSWLMRRVVHTIRVPASTFRREAPELKDAVAALDAGRVLVVFPEGGLRRKEEQPLRQFGQGVWRILQDRPKTPIVVCWIEGGWKSFTSYFLGPPTKNKRIDWWRRIRVAMAQPRVLPPALLADQRGVRSHLMQACLDAREHLGFPPFQAAGFTPSETAKRNKEPTEEAPDSR
jgi:1-acyl-sn-glycerol-3-phosphate acyltransferase/MFS family permease